MSSKLSQIDNRFVRRTLNDPLMRTGYPGMVIRNEPKRGRVHIILHNGAGTDGGYSSQSMPAAVWNRIREQIIESGPSQEIEDEGGAS